MRMSVALAYLLCFSGGILLCSCNLISKKNLVVTIRMWPSDIKSSKQNENAAADDGEMT